MIAAAVVAPRYGPHVQELIRTPFKGACYFTRVSVQRTADLGVSGEELCRLSRNLVGLTNCSRSDWSSWGVAMPTKFRNLACVRAVCQTSRHCRRDLARDDPQVGLESYWLNAPMIDVLTLSTDNRKGSSEDRGDGMRCG
jgi:hypothetical protein